MFLFGSPYYFELTNYEQKEASGLQLTKSPGQFWVYLGVFKFSAWYFFNDLFT